MKMQVVSLIRPSKSKHHGTENNRSWLSTCGQMIKPSPEDSIWQAMVAKLDVKKLAGFRETDLI